MERESSAGAARSSEDAPGGGHGSSDHAGGESELLARWSDREEVRAVPDILRPAELLVAVGSGTVVRSGRLAQSRWLVIVTDRRLLCIKGRDPVTRKVIDMPISQIRGVEVRGLLRKTLSLDTGFGTLRIGSLDKSTAGEFAREVTRLMGAYDEEGHLRPVSRPGAPAAEPTDPAESTRPTGPPAPTPGPARSGAGSPAAATPPGVARAVGALGERVDELTERVAFLEELVRSNVGAGAYDEEPS